MLTKLRPTAAQGTLRVLVVDTTIERIRDVRDVLQLQHQFRSSGARSVEEARHMLEDDAFDAAVVDYDLWADSASALVAAVRQYHPDLAVVLLTNGDNERDALQALKLGAHDFLNREQLGQGEQLATRIMAAVDESRTLRRRDTMVRWLEREARTDHLTGLYNRRAFDERLREVCESARSRQQPVALIIVDVAGTRIVNEAHGHEAGDAMIRRAASGIAHSVRGNDFAARIGGDDFGIILPDGDLDLARRIARRIAHEIDRLNEEEWDGEIPVSVTFGVASGTGCDAGSLFGAADQQLSAHKSVRPGPTLFRIRSHEDGPSVA